MIEIYAELGRSVSDLLLAEIEGGETARECLARIIRERNETLAAGRTLTERKLSQAIRYYGSTGPAASGEQL